MNCESTQKMISLYLAGDLPKEELEAFMAHIVSCRKCRAAFEEAKRYEAALKGVLEESVSKSRSPKSRVLRKIKEQGPRRRGKSLANWFVFILLTGALCLLIVIAYISYDKFKRDNLEKSLLIKRELTLIMDALEEYRADHGAYPTGSNANMVKALKGSKKGKNVPYYTFSPKILAEGRLKDQWDQPCVYRSTGEAALLYSTGPNRTDDNGLRDDIRP